MNGHRQIKRRHTRAAALLVVLIGMVCVAPVCTNSSLAQVKGVQKTEVAANQAVDRDREAKTILGRNDGNGDGFVSKNEARPVLKRIFDRLDLNGDGRLDMDEIKRSNLRIQTGPPRATGGRPPRRPGGGGGQRQQGGRQAADPDFNPEVDRPAFGEGKGPVVLVDEAHFNFHTVEGRYAPFAKLLRRDGYVVRANSEQFTRNVLDGAQVLVIANALAEQNQSNWRLPTPSAFTQQEINEVVKWVSEGGSLLLIADHMPFAGAAQELGSEFDVRFLNGFALPKVRGGAMRFDRDNRQLHDHAVTRGRDEREKVDSVSTFTGSAFQIGANLQPILRFGLGVESLQPEVAWQFSEDTPRKNVEGWCQAAVGQWGKGRVAVFGEAAMFSAQRAGPQGRQFGMNAPEAAQNGQLLLNTLHWLTGLLDNQ